MATEHVSVELEQQQGYEFRVRFDMPAQTELLLDEPPPLGEGQGPNAARMVVAALANCLAASLVFCMRGKFRQNPGPVRATAIGHLERNERGRVRIGRVEVVLSIAEKLGDMPHQERCLGQFEDFCVVTESVRRGIPVSVSVVDGSGSVIHTAGGAGHEAAVPAT